MRQVIFLKVTKDIHVIKRGMQMYSELPRSDIGTPFTRLTLSMPSPASPVFKNCVLQVVFDVIKI